MEYTRLEIVWLFLIYSIAGWILEVCIAAVRKKKFINRGFVNGPLCPIYGFASVLFTLFLPELTNHLFWLFLGGMVLATVLEYSTGVIMHKIFGQKLWDYSDRKWNLDGYICVEYSILWGVSAILTMKFLNPLLCLLLRPIPAIVSLPIVWVGVILLAIDFAGTALAVLGMQKEAARLAQFTEGIQKTSRFLENALTRRVQSRMMKSFPTIDPDVLIREKAAHMKDSAKVFAAGCGYYKLVSLFFLGAFLGDITETIFCLITAGELMSRSSVVYGPFSIVWGLGCAMLTALLYRYKDRNLLFLFIAGTVLGGAYEYICSVFTELVFGTVFWDYSGFALNLGGRINLLYCFFWGIAAIVWFKGVYPLLSKWIEKFPYRPGAVLCNCMVVFMIFNIIISGLALTRYTERNNESFRSEQVMTADPQSGLAQATHDDTAIPVNSDAAASTLRDKVNAWLDIHFDDERMARIYPNAKIVVDGVPQKIKQ